jgi:hypothetical protein
MGNTGKADEALDVVLGESSHVTKKNGGNGHDGNCYGRERAVFCA